MRNAFAGKAVNLLPAAVLLALGMALIVRPEAMGDRVPGDAGDGRYSLVLLEFCYRALAALLHGRAADFLDAPFFYPWPGAANFANNHWGDAAPYVVARALGAGEYLAFQLWFIAGLTLTYASAWWCLRKFDLTPLGAAAGAFLFTFPLPMIAQFGHGEFVYRLWVPAALLAIDRFAARRGVVAGAACILFTALQFAVSNYLGMFLVLLLASYVVALFALSRRRLAPWRRLGFRPPPAGTIAVAALLLAAGLAVLAVVGLSYLDVHRAYGFVRPWLTVRSGLPRPQSYLLAGASRIWPDLSPLFGIAYEGEQQDFPGLCAAIALVWFLIARPARRRHPLAGIMILTAAILTVLTLDIDGHTLYRLIFRMPGFAEMRAVSRVILVTMFPLALVFGLLIDDLAMGTAPRRSWRATALLAALVFLVAESAIGVGTASLSRDWRARDAALDARLPKPLPADAVLAVAGPPLDVANHASAVAWGNVQVDAEIAAEMLGIHTLNGYSGNFPPLWRPMRTCDDVGYTLRAARHYFAARGRRVPAIAPDRLVLVGFGDCDRAALGRDPALVYGQVYRFANGQSGNDFVGAGFSGIENTVRWTEGKIAYLYFSLAAAPSRPMLLAVDAAAFSPARDWRQEIAVAANGQACGSLFLAQGRAHAKTICPAAALRAGENVLRLRVAHPARPVDLGIDSDERDLGMGLRTLTAANATCGDAGAVARTAWRVAIEDGRTVPDKAAPAFAECTATALGGEPPLMLGHPYRFADGADGNVFTGDGFSGAESWGRWTVGANAYLYFSLAPQAGSVAVAVEVEAMAFSARPDRRQDIAVGANGRACGDLVIASGKDQARIVCPAGALRGGDNVLHLRIAAPARPVDVDGVADTRALGLGLKTLTLTGSDSR